MKKQARNLWKTMISFSKMPSFLHKYMPNPTYISRNLLSSTKASIMQRTQKKNRNKFKFRPLSKKISR
jgi:hypothetical protein